MDLLSTIILLFLVLDSIGNIPIFTSILNQVNPEKRIYILLRECSIAFIILICFFLFGKELLHYMNISQISLQISGGIILFLIAIRIIFPTERNDCNEEPFLVPMAIPLISGPGTIATIILLSGQYPTEKVQLFLAILIANVLSIIVLLLGIYLIKIFGGSGIRAIEKLSGLILTTLSIEMLLNGIEAFIKMN